MTSTLDQLVEEYVSQGVKWENLPEYVRNQLGNSQEVYVQEIKNYCMNHLTSFENSLAKHFMNKNGYYTDMINYLRSHLRAFPYQFSDFIVNELKILPFNYYFDMLVDIMKAEKSYDILPNFTAADVNRFLGIGRNQYIDIMNKVRSKWMWKLNKGIVKELLPPAPIPTVIEYWWIVEYFPMNQQEFLKIYNTLTDEEQYAIGIIKKEGKMQASKLPYNALMSIYRKNLIHLHVPIEANDFIIVPPLQNFIMNRTTNDVFEKVLYKLLVTVDERTSVSELSKIIEADVDVVRSAVSMCCRLQFAKRKMIKPINMHETSEDAFHNSWQAEITAYHDSIKSYSLTGETFTVEEGKKVKRIAFMFDSSLTAFLMMGNLSESLKNHAVTLFEVGKMPDELLDEFLTELDKIKPVGEGEGDARRYYRHAVSLRTTLRFLRKNKDFNIPDCEGAVDMIRCESLSNLDPSTRLRILNANYCVLITVAPLAAGTLSLPALIPGFYGPPIPQCSTPWFKIYTYVCAGAGVPSVLFSKGQRLRKLPKVLQNVDKVMVSAWEQEYTIQNSLILLQILNEALISSPNMVQIYEVNEKKPSIVFDVPFPFEDDSQDLLNFDDKPKAATDEMLGSKSLVGHNDIASMVQGSDDKGDNEENKTVIHTDGEKQQIKQIMIQLTQRLHLECSFGFVRMMKEQQVDGTDCIIHPLEIFFGLPLGDEKMNDHVSKLIVKKQLFTAENWKKHTENMKLLSKEFLDFIDSHLDVTLKISTDDGTSIFPTHNIHFDGKQISPLQQ